MKPFKRLTGTLLCASMFAVLWGCSADQTRQAADNPVSFSNIALFGPRPALPTSDELHALSSDQRQDFLDYINAPRNAQVELHQRLYNYLDWITTGFNYQEETLTAREAMDRQTGDCQSLAIVTTALARELDLEVGYQLMDDSPVFQFGRTAVIKGVHVRTIIYDPEWQADHNFIAFSRPGLAIDYFPGNRERFVSNLTENDYLAMYYRNIAAKALQRDDLDAAYWNAVEALRHGGRNAASINTLAVVHRRAGDAKTAEALYRYGIEHANEKLSLMKNYRLLLLSEGRVAEARKAALKLDTMDDPSPFHWYHLARSSAEAGDVEDAIRYYRRALELAPYLHEAHLGLAVASFRAERPADAQRALVSALDHAYRPSTRKLYKAKLISLSQATDADGG